MKAWIRRSLRGLLFLAGVALLVDSLGLRTLEDRETGYARSGYTSIELWLLQGAADAEPGWVGTAELLFAVCLTTLACLSGPRAWDSWARWWQCGKLQFSLRTLLLGMGLIAMVLGLETARRQAVSRSLRGNLIQLYGGETALEAISFPDRIEACPLRPFPNNDPSDAKPSDFPCVSDGLVLEGHTAEMLSRSLRDPTNYHWCINCRPACLVRTCLRIRVVRGLLEIGIDCDPDSGLLSVHRDGSYVHWAYLRDTSVLKNLAKTAAQKPTFQGPSSNESAEQ